MAVTFIDLFAGIGGFHLAFHNLGAKCVFMSEINEAAKCVYRDNFNTSTFEIRGDISLVDTKDIPLHDILCAGFPCQPFSQAGFKKGFEDENRGNMFFEILRILKDKKPPAFFLENVRFLLKHDSGKTFVRIRQEIEKLGYSFHHKVVKASEHGLPQHRPRLFMVGFLNDTKPFNFPEPVPLKLTMSNILGGPCDRTIGFTVRCGGRDSGINDRHNWDSYAIGGSVRRISIQEIKKLMGFPDDFRLQGQSQSSLIRLLGNSVAIPAIQATAAKVIEHLTFLCHVNERSNNEQPSRCCSNQRV